MLSRLPREDPPFRVRCVAAFSPHRPQISVVRSGVVQYSFECFWAPPSSSSSKSSLFVKHNQLGVCMPRMLQALSARGAELASSGEVEGIAFAEHDGVADKAHVRIEASVLWRFKEQLQPLAEIPKLPEKLGGRQASSYPHLAKQLLHAMSIGVEIPMLGTCWTKVADWLEDHAEELPDDDLTNDVITVAVQNPPFIAAISANILAVDGKVEEALSGLSNLRATTRTELEGQGERLQAVEAKLARGLNVVSKLQTGLKDFNAAHTTQTESVNANFETLHNMLYEQGERLEGMRVEMTSQLKLHAARLDEHDAQLNEHSSRLNALEEAQRSRAGSSSNALPAVGVSMEDEAWSTFLETAQSTLAAAAPVRLAPESAAADEPAAPGLPEPVAPEPAPGPSAPESAVPEPTAPEPAVPEPAAPGPAVPEPLAVPESAAPEPAASSENMPLAPPGAPARGNGVQLLHVGDNIYMVTTRLFFAVIELIKAASAFFLVLYRFAMYVREQLDIHYFKKRAQRGRIE